MRFAILSDVHGNIIALKSCFKKIETLNVDGIIWCGDYITDIPKSKQVLKFIRENEKHYKQYIVRGNREDYILNYHNDNDLSWVVGSNESSLLMTYQSLDNDDLEWLQSLPTELWIKEKDYPKILLSHKKIEDTKADIMIYGHTHINDVTYENETRYINPGSVGFPFTRKVGSCFAILDYDNNHTSVEFYHITYPIEETINHIKQSKLSGIKNNWDKLLIKMLLTGEDYITPYLKRMKQLAHENNLSENLDHIPTFLWEQASKELGF